MQTKLPGLALIAILATPATLLAQITTNNWTNVSGGTFSDGANWNTATAPSTTNNVANFTEAGTYTVSFTQNTTVRAVTVGDGNGNKDITFALGGFTLTNSGGQFLMNQNQLNTLTLNNGILNIATDEARIGNSSTTTGMQTMVVGSDAQLLLTGTSSMRLGNSGLGTVRVEAGGGFDGGGKAITIGANSSGNGLLTVTGAGSAARAGGGNFIIGSSGTGRVEVLNGGVLERSGSSNLIVQIGRLAGSSGALVVDGTDSVARLRNVYVGGDSAGAAGGTGLLKVSDGGLVRVSLSPSDGAGTFRVYGGGTVEIDGGRIEAKEGVRFDTGAAFVMTLNDKTTNPFHITTGGITLESGVTLSLFLGATPPVIDDIFTLVTYKGTLSGTFDGLAQGSRFEVGGSTFEIDYGSGLDSAITVQMVPEPNSVALLMIGAAGLAAWRWKRSDRR